MKGDGKTWKRKHRLYHKIQDMLELTDDTCDMLSLNQATLEELVEKIRRKI
jgi:hypothetical protein